VVTLGVVPVLSLLDADMIARGVSHGDVAGDLVAHRHAEGVAVEAEGGVGPLRAGRK
jgi:hypothetical protein